MNKKLGLRLLEERVLTIPSFLFRYYRKIGLTDIECMIILHLYTFIQEGKTFPTYEEISRRMMLSEEHCSQILASLLQRNYIEIDKGYSEDGIYLEKYSLEPLWSRLLDEYIMDGLKEEKKEEEEEEGKIFTIFEEEFGRPLSPIECETLGMWMDQDGQSPALIKQALKEAVLAGKLSFRYIDRILFEWKKNGIKTVEQAERYSRQFRTIQKKQQANTPEEKKRSAVPFYNWLES